MELPKKVLFDKIINDSYLFMAVIDYMRSRNMKTFDEFYEESLEFAKTGNLRK